VTARLKAILVLAVLATGVVVLLSTAGPPPPLPAPPAGSFAFAVMGDAPYYGWEALQFETVLDDLEAHDLDVVIDVGDIFWRPCNDEMYRRSRTWFDALRHPVVYTPGDNEWTDCWQAGSGGFEPEGRLARIRKIFFDEPTRSLGGRPIPLESQSSDSRFREFVENARWVDHGIVFVTVDLPGSRNGLENPERTEEEIDAALRRAEAAAAWLTETFGAAKSVDAKAVVIAFHADFGLGASPDDPYRRAYEPFVETLEREVEAFARPVLLVHGDGHEYTVDHPLRSRVTGEVLSNFERMEVPGSPLVGWVRVVVTPGDPTRFAFDERVVPRWKYW